MFDNIRPLGSQPQNLSSTTVPTYHGSDVVRRNDTRKEAEQTRKRPPNSVSEHLLKQIEQEVETIHNVGLEFTIHKATGRTLIKVIDKTTEKVIREIPPEDLLDLSAKLDEMMGILFDRKV